MKSIEHGIFQGPLKKQITIHIDEDTIEYFRKALYGFQTDRRGRRSVAL